MKERQMIAAGQVSAGHERAMSATRVQLGGLVLLEDFFEDHMPWYTFCDDVSGDQVNEARQVELDWLHPHAVCVRRSIYEFVERTGAKPVRLLWINTNESDGGQALFATFWFSATLPLFRLQHRESGLAPYLLCGAPRLFFCFIFLQQICSNCYCLFMISAGSSATKTRKAESNYERLGPSSINN